jgi:sugar O-acyltransferase (sialic acid O-acetyltransferase NeuD family)
MSRLILWGAGGHGRSVTDITHALNDFEEVVFVDDDPSRVGVVSCGVRIAGTSADLESLRREGFDHLTVTIGDNHRRAACFERARALGFTPTTLIHPSVWISPYCRIGAGTVMLPAAMISADAEIGENCILNYHALIGHDCRIGDHAHISAGTILAGGITVGSFALVGLGSRIAPGVTIGENATVAVGSVVAKPVPAGYIMAGSPGRAIRKRDNG